MKLKNYEINVFFPSEFTVSVIVLICTLTIYKQNVCLGIYADLLVDYI